MAALPTTNKLAVMATHTNNGQTNRQHDQQQQQHNINTNNDSNLSGTTL